MFRSAGQPGTACVRRRFGAPSGKRPPRALVACALSAWLAAGTAETARAAPAASATGPLLAIYDGGDKLPLEALAVFEQVVLDPARVSDADLQALRQRGPAPLARVRPGGGRPGDLLAPLERRGFAGFVVDGRDEAQGAAADQLLREARRRGPTRPIYYWGSPDRISGVADTASGFITDGVFTAGLAPGGVERPPEVLDDLEGVRRLAGLVEQRGRARFPVVVVERVPGGQREQARGMARTLAERGFVPWVVVGGRSLGMGLTEWVPRRILALYDGEEEPDLPYTMIHRLAAMPLEHLGYVVDYHDVHGGPLPGGDLGARYAGIVSWFSDDDMAQPRAYEGFLAEQISRGMKVAMLGRPGFQPSAALLARLGLGEATRRVLPPVIIHQTAALVGFEARPSPLSRDLPRWQARGGAEPLIELRDQGGARLHPVMTAWWGGLALDPYLVDRGLAGRVRWIVNPFAFLTQALDLEPIPVPDPTTENGRRLLFIHIDGDSFASMAEMPGKYFSGQIIMRDFLERYPFPTTVSIIEGETSASGVYPQLSARLEGLAREIFRLPNVEVASHSFSHPFDWVAAAKGAAQSANLKDPVHMPIAGYRYTAAREVSGSIRYINDRLAPPEKPARVFLWSGAALPGADALKEADAAGLLNMNGGACELPGDAPTLSQIPAFGRVVNGHLQVYAQAQNENVYTNEWTGPFYGFRDVIRMFRYSESPRRLKPINIYYHFYSGTKHASISALHEVYQYALGEQTLPIVVGEMVPKVQDFYRVTMSRRIDGSWDLRGLRELRTVRIDKRLGWPDLGASSGVAGVQDVAQGRYVALTGAETATLALGARKPSEPHLVEANARLLAWEAERGRVKFRLKGHQPVVMTVGGCAGGGGSGARVRVDGGRRLVQLSFPGSDTREVTLTCR